MPVAAVGAEYGVFRRQVGANAGGDRFLADVSVAGAEDQSALVQTRQLLFALPNELHRAIQGQQSRFVDRRRGAVLSDGFGA